MSHINGSILDRMHLLKSWSRHHNYKTPKSQKDVWFTSYQKSFDTKKIGYSPDRYILDYFNGNTRVMASRKSRDSDRLRSSFNDRARDGFKYWMVDRPRPSYFGKYGTGSYKTVLGIGNAPRT